MSELVLRLNAAAIGLPGYRTAEELRPLLREAADALNSRSSLLARVKEGWILTAIIKEPSGWVATLRGDGPTAYWKTIRSDHSATLEQAVDDAVRKVG